MVKKCGFEGVNSINMAHGRAKVCVVNTVVDPQVPFCIDSYLEPASRSQCSL